MAKKSVAKKPVLIPKSEHTIETYLNVYKKPVIGCKTALTKTKIKQIMKAVENGMYQKQAVAVVGLGERVYYKYKDIGLEALRQVSAAEKNNEQDIYLSHIQIICIQFVQEIQKAEALAEQAAIQAVKSKFKEDWRAAMTFLERRFPERWGRKVITISESDTEESAAKQFYSALEAALSDD